MYVEYSDCVVVLTLGDLVAAANVKDNGFPWPPPGLPALCALAPRQRVSRCRTPVTGAAADEYNLNVVDCDASVTVPRLSSISVLKWGYPQPAGATVET